MGPGAELTFGAQDTFVLPLPGGSPGDFILLADHWQPEFLRESRYVWLPLHVHGEKIIVEWHEAWELPANSRFA